MVDMHSVTTTRGWGDRIKGALIGFILGPVCIVGSTILLWNNETESVRTAKGLSEGAAQVVHTEPESLDTTLEGKLIHTTGKVETTEILKDDVFGVETNAIKLKRKVEVYQWEEKSESRSTDNYGGSETTTTTYTYNKKWTDRKIDSSMFNDSINHTNPTSWKYDTTEKEATTIMLGDIQVGKVFVDQIEAEKNISLSGRTIVLSGTGIKTIGDTLYVGRDLNNPEIGDVRISFFEAPNQQMSLIGKLSGGILDTFITKNGTNISLIQSGNISADAMFQNAQDANTLWTWIFRGIGLLIMFIGFSLIFNILVILAKVIPPLSTILGWGTGLIAFLLTLILGGTVIAIAWLFARPIISIVVLIIVGGILYLFYLKKRGDSNTLSPTEMTVPKV